MGLEVVRSGIKLTQGRFQGTIDLIVRVLVAREFTDDQGNHIVWSVGDELIIDLKYSGLVGETKSWRNKHGWQWSDIQKEYHGTQAIQYHYVGKRPFYFLVTQSSQKEEDDPDVYFYHIPVTAMMIQEQIKEGNALHDRFTVMAKFGFTPRPSFLKCKKCSLFPECEFRHDFPHPEIVHLNFD
jgi:hypothetical protein